MSASGFSYDGVAAHYDLHRGWEACTPLRLLELAAGGTDGLEPAGPVLEVGCGTGNVTRWLLGHWPGPVLALDLSRGMLAQARAKLGDARIVRAPASRLPFRDGAFRGVLGSFVLHHLDAGARAMALAEFHRVLAKPGARRGRREASGGLAFLTSSHAQIHASYLCRWFPSVAQIDCARFPDIDELRRELGHAGFVGIGAEDVLRPRPPGGKEYLDKVRARFVSTLALLPEEEFARGLAAMERQLAADGQLGEVSWHGTIVHARAG